MQGPYFWYPDCPYACLCHASCPSVKPCSNFPQKTSEYGQIWLFSNFQKFTKNWKLLPGVPFPVCRELLSTYMSVPCFMPIHWIICKMFFKNIRTLPNMHNFQLSKIPQKMKNNDWDPISSILGTTVHMHVCTKFYANPLNHVENFPRKLQIVHSRRTDTIKTLYFPEIAKGGLHLK